MSEEQIGLAPAGVEAEPHYYRRNALAFMADMAIFRTAISFISSSTVLPAFIALLAGSEAIVGLVQGLIDGAWFLPQLLSASAVSRLPRKKPVILRAVIIGRSLLFPLAVLVGYWGASRPKVVLVATALTFFLFYIADGIASVPWFEILAKSLPDRRRGRVLGVGQVVGGVGGIASGMAVRWILSDACPWQYPTNFAALIAIGGGLLMVALIPLVALYEPTWETAKKAPPSVGQTLRSVPQIVRRDRSFGLLILIRLLATFGGVAIAFYVLHGQRNLGFSTEDLGLFVSAQVFGSLLSGFLTGLLQDRWGPLAHMRVVIGSAVLVPVIALLALPLQPALGANLVYYYMLLYVVMGIYLGSFAWPYLNWIFEHTGEADRSLYIGIVNTTAALAMFAPPLGGWIVSVASYQAAFGTALAFALAALALTLWLPDTRRRKSAPAAPDSHRTRAGSAS